MSRMPPVHLCNLNLVKMINQVRQMRQMEGHGTAFSHHTQPTNTAAPLTVTYLLSSGSKFNQ